MNVLLLTGASRSDRIKKFLMDREDSVLEYAKPLTLEFCRDMEIEFMVVHGYGFVLSEPVISAYRRKIVNMHDTFLPWGQGLMGHVWSIFEDTPTGVTLHAVDEAMHQGMILAQELVQLEPESILAQAAETLNDRVEALFMASWNRLATGDQGGLPRKIMPVTGPVHDRTSTEQLRALVGHGQDISVRQVYALGREWRSNPVAFNERHGLSGNCFQQSASAAPLDGPGAEPGTPEAASPGTAAMRNAPVTVREAEMDDLLINWVWINDPVTRKMFKSNEYVGWEGHVRWYSRMLDNRDMVLCIGECDGTRIGNVRFDRQDPGVWEISINVDPHFRGMGLGPRMLRAAMSFLESTRRVSRFFSMAKKTNGPSISSFAKADMPVVVPTVRFVSMEFFDPETEVYMEKAIPEGGG